MYLCIERLSDKSHIRIESVCLADHNVSSVWHRAWYAMVSIHIQDEEDTVPALKDFTGKKTDKYRTNIILRNAETHGRQMSTT